ncbi:MAG: hypothetical protein ABH836_05845 [Candidatus Omnitrophota bacterium]
MKKVFKAVVFLVVLILIIAFSKNIITRNIITGVVKASTGLKLNIDSVNLGIFTTLIDIKGLQLNNPPDFKDKVMIGAPQIYVDYNLISLFQKKKHLKEVSLYLKEFIIVKNKDGILNLSSLKTVKETQKKEMVPADKKKEKKATEIQIDVLKLKIDRVIYKDYTQGSEPVVKEYNINIDEKYEDISDIQALAKLIIYRTLAKTALDNIINLDINPFKNSISDILKKTGGMLNSGTGETTKEAVDKLKKIFEDIKVPAGQ